MILNDSCEKIVYHVGRCKKCQESLLSYSPIDKFLMKGSTIKNELLEITIHLISGLIIIGMMFVIAHSMK